MFKKIFPVPQYPTKQEQRNAALLSVIQNVFGASLLVHLGLYALGFFGPDSLLVVSIELILVVLVKLLLSRRQLQLATYVFLSGFSISVFAIIWVYSGIQSYLLVTLVLLVIIVGMLLGRKWMIGVTVLAIIYVALLYALGEVGLYQPPRVVKNLYEEMFVFISTLITITGFVFVTIRDAESALEDTTRELATLEQSEARLSQQTQHLAVLHDVRTSMLGAATLQEIYRKLAEEIHQKLKFQHVSITLIDAAGGKFQLIEQLGHQYPFAEILMSEGVVSRAYQTGQPVFIPDVSKEPNFKGAPEIVSAIYVPMLHGDQVIAIINVESDDAPLTHNDLNLLVMLAGYVNVSIERVFSLGEQARSELRYGSLFEQTNDGVYLFDIEGGFFAVNQRGAEMLGYPVEELLGRTAQYIVLPDEVDDGEKRKQSMLRGEQLPNYERTFVRKDGTHFVGEINLTLVKDDNNHPAYFQSVVRDVTARRLAEDKAISERNLLQSLIDAVPDGIYAKDKDSRFMVANRMVWEGWGLENWDAIVGKRDKDFLKNSYAESTRAEEQEILETGNRLLDKEEFYQNEAGEVVTTLTTKVPLHDDDGNIIGIVGTTRNISLLKQAEAETRRLNTELEDRVKHRTQELEEANQELEAFAYTVSHDLRAPLRAIDGYAAILKEEMQGKLSEEDQRFLDQIQNNITRMDVLIKGLLDFSRLSKLKLACEETNLQKVAEESWQELAPLRQSNANEPQFILEEIGSAYVDRLLLQQVFTNLLSNALKFSKESNPPQITVGVKDYVDKKVYFVSDNGVGFDLKFGAKIFGVFERLYAEQDYEGTGVGLAVVRRIIERHGGEVWAEAEPGSGACFYFTVPDVSSRGSDSK